ncbi:cation:proton antiporter [Sphingomonas sp. HF-S4]|uniref:Cation:proton antiporter n=1 Tax=Sphingomonas agrestis TaxID=3080540 RepID=A0ABU3Y9H8_9SPHN|nr:cation:proton antiporter [Sphingomonas sp. HF-S4]MDV3458036.1 cation:proton antiporter [Sphingomonas sp. HF-S4]
MTFFESLVALLLLAVVLLQVARRTPIPYPTMLAAAGVIVALVPGSPSIAIDGHTALALFIAPVLLDAAFDFPLAAIRRLWRPLVALAVVAVLLTTAVVAWIGWALAGLPLLAAITLGAIVAPPDAAAATTVLRSAALPRRTVQVLTGESLLNDGTALLLFGAAVAVHSHGSIDGGVVLRLGFAVPGGIALGLACAWLFRFIFPYTRGSFGGNLLEFVNTFFAWLLAERLGLSAVMCVVTMAMSIANSPHMKIEARNRIQSFAVWGVAVFVLNVVAFLLMGMQARAIVGSMTPDHLRDAAGTAGLVVAGVVVTRMAWVLLYNRLAARFRWLHGEAEPASLAQGVIVGWCGMRGLVTLATSFALPADFPQRDVIVLSAFAVVLATLVVQGLTLAPLIRLLGLGEGDDRHEYVAAQRALAQAALGTVSGEQGRVASEIRRQFEIDLAALDGDDGCGDFLARREIKLRAIEAQRERLHALRDDDAIGAEQFERLQEALDWHELSIASAERRTIDES